MSSGDWALVVLVLLFVLLAVLRLLGRYQEAERRKPFRRYIHGYQPTHAELGPPPGAEREPGRTYGDEAGTPEGAVGVCAHCGGYRNVSVQGRRYGDEFEAAAACPSCGSRTVHVIG